MNEQTHKPRYLVVGVFTCWGEAGRRVFLATNNRAKAVRIYRKLDRLCDLQFPTTASLRREYRELLREVTAEGAVLFDDPKDPEEFTLDGLYCLCPGGRPPAAHLCACPK